MVRVGTIGWLRMESFPTHLLSKIRVRAGVRARDDLRLVIAWQLVGVVGCVAQDERVAMDGGSLVDAMVAVASDPFEPVSVASQHAVAICDFKSRCMPVLGDIDPGGVKCISEQREILVAAYLANERAIRVGRAGFSQRGFEECIRGYTEANCEEFARADACLSMFVGVGASGAPCGGQIECAAGLYCSAVDGECGQCKPYLRPGASCADDTGVLNGLCEPGFMCNARTCVSRSQPKGAACGTRETGLCSGALQCVGAEAGVCTEPDGRVGAVCSVESVESCNMYEGTQCGVGALCERIRWVQAGAACGPSTRTQLCVPGTYCNGTSCVALPEVGEPCVRLLGLCGAGAYCDATGLCAQQVQEGGACVSDGRQCFRSATGALFCNQFDTSMQCADTAMQRSVSCTTSDPCRGPSVCVSGSCRAVSIRTDCR